MAIDSEQVAAALSTPAHPASEVLPVVGRYLVQSNYEQEYQDCLALESFRKTLAELPVEERRRRAVAFVSCWDGDGDIEARSRFSRAGFAQGIDYHQLRDGEEPALIGPSFAPISSTDVDALMGALTFAGKSGAELAASVDFAAYGSSDPRVFEWFREAFERKEPHRLIKMAFASPREVNDRLLALMLAPLGEEPSLDRFFEHVLSTLTTGAQDVEALDVCSRWLTVRGYEPVVPAIDLRNPSEWDGGHASGGNAVHRLLARLWSADEVLVEETAEKLFSKMWAADVVAAICSKLPFDEKVEVERKDGYERLYRKGRLVVTHKGKPGTRGKIGVTLHDNVAKAEKDSKKKVAALRKDR